LHLLKLTVLAARHPLKPWILMGVD